MYLLLPPAFNNFQLLGQFSPVCKAGTVQCYHGSGERKRHSCRQLDIASSKLVTFTAVREGILLRKALAAMPQNVKQEEKSLQLVKLRHALGRAWFWRMGQTCPGWAAFSVRGYGPSPWAIQGLQDQLGDHSSFPWNSPKPLFVFSVLLLPDWPRSLEHLLDRVFILAFNYLSNSVKPSILKPSFSEFILGACSDVCWTERNIKTQK